MDSRGTVTAVGAGETTVTATVDGKVLTSKIRVTYEPLMNNTKYTKGYKLIASYDSETLKYLIESTKDEVYTLIWVENAYKQWNSALPKVGSRYTQKEILTKEIIKYGYQKKGLIASNASPFYDSWGNSPCTPYLINHGNIVRDIKNTKYKTVYPTLGMKKDGILEAYKFSKTDYTVNKKIKQQMKNDGVKNNFAFFSKITINNKISGNTTCNVNDSSTYCFHKTVLCQIDNNNFVIFSGGKSLSYNGVARKLGEKFNCKTAYIFDGGSSSSLYYKKTNSIITGVYKGQSVPDMMYFVEQ